MVSLRWRYHERHIDIGDQARARIQPQILFGRIHEPNPHAVVTLQRFGLKSNPKLLLVVRS